MTTTNIPSPADVARICEQHRAAEQARRVSDAADAQRAAANAAADADDYPTLTTWKHGRLSWGPLDDASRVVWKPFGRVLLFGYDVLTPWFYGAGRKSLADCLRFALARR
jgi:hypothetical protein